MININEVVRILLDEKPPSFEFEKELAIAYFSNWLNSRMEDTQPGELIFITFLRFVEQSKNLKNCLDYNIISKMFDGDVIFDKLFNSTISIPDYWFNKEFTTYDETDYVSDIVRFMLSYKPALSDKRLQASLGKAYVYINEQAGFEPTKVYQDQPHYCSLSKHQIIWKKFKQSSPFQYVRYHDSEIDWMIDPRSITHIAQLTSLANETKKISDYFAKCLWVQLQLQQTVDQRSMVMSDFISFPDHFEPKECHVPKFPEKAYKALKNYERNRAVPKK